MGIASKSGVLIRCPVSRSGCSDGGDGPAAGMQDVLSSALPCVLYLLGVAGQGEGLICRVTYLALDGLDLESPFHHTE
jgi:hypothetical protein